MGKAGEAWEMALAGIKICMDNKVMEAMASNNRVMANKVMTSHGINKVTDSSRRGVDSNLSKVMVMQMLVADTITKANNLKVLVDMEVKTKLQVMVLLKVVLVDTVV